MKKLGLVFAALLVLVGCGSGSKISTTVCTANEVEDFKPYEATIVHEGDALKSFDFKMRVTASSKEEADEVMETGEKDFSKVFGDIGFKLERKSDTEVDIIFNLDFAKNSNEIAAMFGNGKNTEDIKATEVIKNIENDNFTCKAQ